MERTKTYGKSPENPVNLNSIPASIIFRNNLVTEKGYHLVYHRKGSLSGLDYKPIDHYEIMTSTYMMIFSSIFIMKKANGFHQKDFCLKIRVKQCVLN
jgi:hypothetical protein